MYGLSNASDLEYTGRPLFVVATDKVRRAVPLHLQSFLFTVGLYSLS